MMKQEIKIVQGSQLNTNWFFHLLFTADYHQQPQTMIAGAGLMSPAGAGLMSPTQEGLCLDAEDPRPEPSDLFVDLGMLILEGRKPEHSAKGRVEGEHCPSPYHDSKRHQCTPSNVARVGIHL